ncbi:MAG: recombination protein O N-terminal domain-containing protein [Minisyncoccia bacterium]
MSYHIYHTRGIILESQHAGESNRSYKIFTEELGLIYGTAQSVREEKSKLRYALQDFSFVTVDLIRGKEVWRILSAGEWRPLEIIKKNPTQLKLFASYCALILRLIHGEGRDQSLFCDILMVADFLEKETVACLNKSIRLSFKTLRALRALVHLGYIDPKGYEKFLALSEYSTDILEEFEEIRSSVLSKINEALRVSHL